MRLAVNGYVLRVLRSLLHRGGGVAVAARSAAVSLLKIQFGAIEGREQSAGPSPILRGSTLIAMMQAANLREGNYVVACAG
jgi:hypothetical protein